MADDRLRFILSFLAETAGLKNAEELAELLGESLGDAEDAGKQMAAAMKAAADKAQKDLADTVEMADKLAQALGPELTAKVNVDEIAGKMRAAGVSIEQVDANIDSFRQSLEQMAQTADQADARMGALDDGVRRVGDTTDRSRSVMANFTGNALQEVPMLTGAFGPLTMAAGQFAEYAAEGNISIKGLAATAAPILAISLLMGALSKRTEEAEKHTENLTAAQDALAKGEAEAAARKLEETFRSTYNLAEQYGIALDDVTRALMGNEAAAQRVDDAMGSMAVSTEEQDDMANAYVEDAQRLHDALRTGAAEWQNTGNATEAATGRIAAILPVMEKAATAVDGTTDKTDALRTAWDLLKGSVSGELDYEEAVYGMQRALDALLTTTDDSKTLVDEHAEALTGAKQQALDVAAAFVEQERQIADLNGTTYTSADAMKDQAGALALVAAGLAPDSDLRVWLEGYIGQLERAKAATILPGGSRVGEAARDGQQPWTPAPTQGSGSMAGEAARGGTIVVQLQMDGRTVQEITAEQSNQQRGQR